MATVKFTTAPTYIVCCRVANVSYVVPGCLTANCAKCGELVLVSPSSLEIRQGNPNSQLICIECVLPIMEEHGGEIAELTPAQVQEIEEYRKHSYQNS